MTVISHLLTQLNQLALSLLSRSLESINRIQEAFLRHYRQLDSPSESPLPFLFLPSSFPFSLLPPPFSLLQTVQPRHDFLSFSLKEKNFASHPPSPHHQTLEFHMSVSLSGKKLFSSFCVGKSPVVPYQCFFPVCCLDFKREHFISGHQTCEGFFPRPNNLRHQLGVLHRNSVLILSTQKCGFQPRQARLTCFCFRT